MVRRPCWVEISTGAFEENYRVLAEACGGNAGPSAALRSAQDDAFVDRGTVVELLAIVKADAYGHGLALSAPAAVSRPAPDAARIPRRETAWLVLSSLAGSFSNSWMTESALSLRSESM